MNSTSVSDLASLLTNAQNATTIEALLMALLTTKEQAEICHRIDIMKLLLLGLPQREIAQRLNVGIATVSRGASTLRAAPHIKSHLNPA